jgi:hypothetical protein
MTYALANPVENAFSVSSKTVTSSGGQLNQTLANNGRSRGRAITVAIEDENDGSRSEERNLILVGSFLLARNRSPIVLVLGICQIGAVHQRSIAPWTSSGTTSPCFEEGGSIDWPAIRTKCTRSLTRHGVPEDDDDRGIKVFARKAVGR